MFCSRKSNNRINKINERSKRIVTDDKNSNFKDLLEPNNQITVHQRNLQVLMTQVIKIINSLSPQIMDNFFIFCEYTHNVRDFQVISNENKKTVRYGQETKKFRTPSLRASLPEEYKLANSLNIFKRKIKNWKCETWPCRLCQTFQKVLGFIYLYLFVCLFCLFVCFFCVDFFLYYYFYFFFLVLLVSLL